MHKDNSSDFGTQKVKAAFCGLLLAAHFFCLTLVGMSRIEQTVPRNPLQFKNKTTLRALLGSLLFSECLRLKKRYIIFSPFFTPRSEKEQLLTCVTSHHSPVPVSLSPSSKRNICFLLKFPFIILHYSVHTVMQNAQFYTHSHTNTHMPEMYEVCACASVCFMTV